MVEVSSPKPNGVHFKWKRPKKKKKTHTQHRKLCRGLSHHFQKLH